MPYGKGSNLENELDAFIAAFEASRAVNSQVNLEAFLPAPGHQLYREVLRELVRVDLEYGWSRGRPTRLAEYRQRFPILFKNLEDVSAIAFEEYRLRVQAGDKAEPAEYQRCLGIDTSGWPLYETPVRGIANCHCLQPSESHHAREEGGPEPNEKAHEAFDLLPLPGVTFLGFELIAELGRGTFATVYLARQGELADRPVALKVSCDVSREPYTLAQLQHTNIVPIHSMHRAGAFQAVCMPFLGTITLKDVLRELQEGGGVPASGKELIETVRLHQTATERSGGPTPSRSEVSALPPAGTGNEAGALLGSQAGLALKTLETLSYVEAVLWIGSRLAAGLAHAHERGIVHRDLKPANVLLADDGQPMLLDFNLADDTKLALEAKPATIGGTLPYMAPEQLRAFQQRVGTVDGRIDVYALGVILYELLAGRHPYPQRHGSLADILTHAIADRKKRPPSLRALNPALSPAVEAIVNRCMEADPNGRYQAARQLHEDLERQMAHLPLRHTREPSLRERTRKWARRHPRLTSGTSVATVAAVLLLVLGLLIVVRGQRLARLEAAETLAQFHKDVRRAQVLFLDAPTGESRLEGIAGAIHRALDHYHILDDPSWQEKGRYLALDAADQQRLSGEVGELLFLLSALTRLQADLEGESAHRNGLLARASDLNRRAEECYPEGLLPAAVWYERALVEDETGRPEEARHCREKADACPPRTARDHCMLACMYAAQGRFRRALPHWQRASLWEPQNVWAWYGLASCYENLGRSAQAAACYSACIALVPDFYTWYLKRGLAELRQKEYTAAAADLDQAVHLKPDDTEAYVNRALAKLGLGQSSEAVQDLTRALNLGTISPRLLLIRAKARERAHDAAGAARDRAEALHHEPMDAAGWVARGVARIAAAPQAALDDFNRALQINPRCLDALEDKAHVLAERLGRVTEAVQALDRAVAWYPEYAPTRAARGVLLARLGRCEAALHDAQEALAVDRSAATLYQCAGVYALTSQKQPGDRAQAMALLTAALRHGYGHELVRTDPDLEPLRRQPAFRQVLEAVSVLQPAHARAIVDGP